jgi:hypothetical protein
MLPQTVGVGFEQCVSIVLSNGVTVAQPERWRKARQTQFAIVFINLERGKLHLVIDQVIAQHK